MKKNNFLITISLIFSLGLCSCSDTKNVSFSINFIFEHVYSPDKGNYLAMQLFNNNYLSSGFEEVEVPNDLIAGDILNIEYTGEIFALESFPGHLILDGDIISYNFEKTDIFGIHSDDSYISVDSLKNKYILDNDYVILNESMEYISLDEFEGYDLYLSVNKSKLAKCPDGAWCEPTMYNIAGIYAYYPRKK